MKPLLMALVFSVLSTLGFAEDYPVGGPENLRQHVEPAVELANKFIEQFDLSNFRTAQDYVGESEGGRLWFTAGVMKMSSEGISKFGKIISREVKSARVSQTYPQRVDGTYVIVMYSAKYPKKETLPQRVVVRINASGKPEIVAFSHQATGEY
jgi:hypothetical protein